MFSKDTAWLKVTAALMAYSLLLSAGSFYLGKSEGRSFERSENEVKAAKAALKRIAELEKSDAKFNALAPRDRCVAFMRSSRLPVSACD